MYEFELGEVEEEFGAEAGMKLKFKALDIVQPMIQKLGGIDVEDSLWIFKDSNRALQSALDMQRKLASYNKKQENEHDKIKVTGYGIHQGEILFI